MGRPSLGDITHACGKLALLSPFYRNAIARWNLFGITDLIAAVALGLTSAQGSPVQLIHIGVGSEAMQHLPFSLVPTVLVPFYLLTHAAVAVQLSARARINSGS